MARRAATYHIGIHAVPAAVVEALGMSGRDTGSVCATCPSMAAFARLVHAAGYGARSPAATYRYALKWGSGGGVIPDLEPGVLYVYAGLGRGDRSALVRHP